MGWTRGILAHWAQLGAFSSGNSRGRLKGVAVAEGAALQLLPDRRRGDRLRRQRRGGLPEAAPAARRPVRGPVRLRSARTRRAGSAPRAASTAKRRGGGGCTDAEINSSPGTDRRKYRAYIVQGGPKAPAEQYI